MSLRPPTSQAAAAAVAVAAAAAACCRTYRLPFTAVPPPTSQPPTPSPARARGWGLLLRHPLPPMSLPAPPRRSLPAQMTPAVLPRFRFAHATRCPHCRFHVSSSSSIVLVQAFKMTSQQLFWACMAVPLVLACCTEVQTAAAAATGTTKTLKCKASGRHGVY